MIDLTGQKALSGTLAVVLALVLLAGVLAANDSRMMPWSFAVLGAAALMVVCAVRGSVALWIWVWVLSFGLLDRWFWVLEVEGFFNLSIPRLIFVGVVGMFFVYFLVRREPIHFDGVLTWFMLALILYVAASAAATGWTSSNEEVRSAPYFRFFAGLLFPFLAFLLMYNAANGVRQVRWVLVAITIYGFYALWVGYIQGIELLGGPDLRRLLWPAYINLELPGTIHFDRARGAFPAAGPQAVFLVFLFYVDLYLVRHLRGPYRWILALQALLVLPALIFTGIRAGYVAFAVAGIIWCVWGLRGRFGWIKLSLASLAILLAILMQWGAISGTERLRGGVAQRGPIQARLLLLKRTVAIVADKPIFGVGFGHFVDAQGRYPRDPAGLSAYASGTLVEHNILLNMAAETGLVGLALYAGLFVALFRLSLRLWRKLPADIPEPFARGLVVLFWVMLANYLVSGMFRDMLWDPFANALLWSLAGLTLGLSRSTRPQLAPAPVLGSAQPAAT